jgi:hypothetical protein
MWLTVGKVGAIELTLSRVHDVAGKISKHVHSMEIATSMDAQQLAQRLQGR